MIVWKVDPDIGIKFWPRTEVIATNAIIMMIPKPQPEAAK